MSMCASCHNRKTRGEQLGKELPIKGCDVYGYPLDPRHPWYKGSPLRDKERLEPARQVVPEDRASEMTRGALFELHLDLRQRGISGFFATIT